MAASLGSVDAKQNSGRIGADRSLGVFIIGHSTAHHKVGATIVQIWLTPIVLKRQPNTALAWSWR